MYIRVTVTVSNPKQKYKNKFGSKRKFFAFDDSFLQKKRVRTVKIWKINSDIYELYVRNILSYILSLSMTYWLLIIRITQICQLDVCNFFKKCLWKNFDFSRSQYEKWCVRCLYIVSYESFSRKKDLWFYRLDCYTMW